MVKKNKNALSVYMESIGLFFSNIDKFMQYMTFPVLGQYFGLILIFFTINIYLKNISNLIDKFPQLNNIYTIVFLTAIVILPGLAIFLKAFWEYLIAYGAVNSMCENMQKSGRVYDFDAHREVVTRRKSTFVGIWLFLGLLSILSLCPFFLIICAVLFIYYIVVFQVFTFNNDLSALGCIKKSFSLIKGHFASTFMLLALVSAFCYVLLPQLLIKIFDYISVNSFLASLVVPLVGQFNIPNLEIYGLKNITELDISFWVVKMIIAQIIIQYTLPFRSIVWTLWYKKLDNKSSSVSVSSSKNKKKKYSSNKKRPSERLMENTHKKFASKKLDRNIIRRASEKDED